MYLIVDGVRLDCKEVQPTCKLEFEDHQNQHSWKDSHGRWIRPYMERMEHFANQLSPIGFIRPSSFFSGVSQLNFDFIQDRAARKLVVEFTNQHYHAWLAKSVVVPDYEEIRVNNRLYCFDCQEGWSCPFRRGRKRTFTCQEDCSEYDDIVADEIARRSLVNVNALDDRWYAFLDASKHNKMPDLKPVWLQPERSIRDVEVVTEFFGGSRTPVSDLVPPIIPLLSP